MKYDLTDEDLQALSDKMKYYVEVKYKDVIGDIPEHIVSSLCQNYVIDCKNNNIDLDKLLDSHNIAMDKEDPIE